MSCSGIESQKEIITDNIYESPAFHGLNTGIRPGGAALTEHLLKLCGFAERSRIADIGCGDGYTAGYISDRFDYDVTGVDCSLMMLGRGAEKNSGLRLVNADSRFLPFRDGSMNGVLMECSFSAMNDQGAVLHEVRRILADNGKLAVSDIYIRNRDCLQTGTGGLRGTCLSGAMTGEQINNIFIASGFSVILWEDQSRLWREFVAGLIMSRDSERGNPVTDELLAAASMVKPGYYSLIAVKS